MVEIEAIEIGALATMFVVVGIPAYNEERTIARVVIEAQKFAKKVVAEADDENDEDDDEEETEENETQAAEKEKVVKEKVEKLNLGKEAEEKIKGLIKF